MMHQLHQASTGFQPTNRNRVKPNDTRVGWPTPHDQLAGIAPLPLRDVPQAPG